MITSIIIALIAGGTLIHGLQMRRLARVLKTTPRPYTALWCGAYVVRTRTMRGSLVQSLCIVASATSWLFFLLVLHMDSVMEAALFGGTNALCMSVLYVLWRWAGWLMETAVAGTIAVPKE